MRSQDRSQGPAQQWAGPLHANGEINMKTFLPLTAMALLGACTFTVMAGPDPQHVHEGLGFDEQCGCGKAEVLRQRFLAGLPVNDFDGGSGGGGYHAREAMT